MAVLLVRCDDRLIHGQCVLRLLNDYRIDRIILIDDATAQNPMMKKICELAVPATTKVLVTTEAEAPGPIAQAGEDDSKALVLFKAPQTAVPLFADAGLGLIRELNVGPMSNRPGSKKATMYSHLVPEEIAALNTLKESGVEIYFQQVPGEKKVPWEGL